MPLQLSIMLFILVILLLTLTLLVLPRITSYIVKLLSKDGKKRRKTKNNINKMMKEFSYEEDIEKK